MRRTATAAFFTATRVTQAAASPARAAHLARTAIRSDRSILNAAFSKPRLILKALKRR